MQAATPHIFCVACPRRKNQIRHVIFTIVGGIGLFLLGMVLLTDGLKSFAGDSLRRALLRFTGRPVTAFFSGLTVTAMVQSSSATTLATIGFVSAGLLTFPQAIGILMGASLGTTSTGWIVSTIGLKFSIGAFALPLTGFGAFLRLIGKGRWSSFGLALAGFGLIFLGIDTLQDGMRGISETINLKELGGTGWFSLPILVLIGIGMTVVMQSSSAAVATTLTALHADAIGFNQAAVLVIGQAIGTTVTAGIAAFGATTSAQRTALAHILFNSATGVVALLLLPLYLLLLDQLEGAGMGQRGSIALAGFHTTFIAVGVLLFLPCTNQFAKLIERLRPERGNRLTSHLDSSLYTMPAIALEAARNTLRSIALEEAQYIHTYICGGKPARAVTTREERIQALEATRQFVGGAPMEQTGDSIAGARIALFHAIDHLMQLMQQRLPETLETNDGEADLVATKEFTLQSLELARNHLDGKIKGSGDSLKELQQRSKRSAARRRELRPKILEAASLGKKDSAHTLAILDRLRWLDSVIYHYWRIANYLGSPGQVVVTRAESRQNV